MSRLLIAAFIAVLLFGSVPVARWQIRRARREESVQDRFIREACTPGLEVWDDNTLRWVTLPPGVRPGPSQYTDRQLGTLDELTLAWNAPAFGETTVDPAWADGLERLYDAVRDNQNGDQT